MIYIYITYVYNYIYNHIHTYVAYSYEDLAMVNLGLLLFLEG